MYNAVLLFFLLQLTLLARYLVFGAFEPITYASTFLILTAAFAIPFISNKFMHKELNYQPNNISGWSFYLRENVALAK